MEQQEAEVQPESTEAPVEPSVEPQVEPQAEPQVDTETQDEARKYGWRPKEEFDLNPEGWVDAERFLELPSTQRKQLQDVNRNLQEKLDAQNAQMDQVRKEAAKAAKLAMEEAERRHRAEMARIISQQREAVETADTEKYDALERQKLDLYKSQPQPEPPSASPEFTQLMNKSTWAKDPMLVRFAADSINMAGPEMLAKSDVEQFKYAESKIREYFPQKFEQPKPTIQKVDGGGLGAAPKTRGANSLPAEARAAGKEFVEQGLFKSLDDYAKSYFEGEE